MVRKILYIIAIVLLTLFMFVEIGDIIQVFRVPEIYPFGKGDLPWYYKSQKMYLLNGGIYVIWIIFGIWLGIRSLRRKTPDRYFVIYTIIFALYLAFMILTFGR